MTATHDRVIVPPHTPKPLPSHLRSELTSALLSSPAIPVIQSTLHQASRNAGWADSIRERTKQLINGGNAANWQEVVEMLVKESCETLDNLSNVPGGLRRVRQHQNGSVEAARSSSEVISVRFPEQAITEGKKAIRDALDHLVDVEGNGITR